jgi:hypothetical protein
VITSRRTPRYRRGLAVVLQTLGTSVDLTEVRPSELELSLPARRTEVEDAFATFRGGVLRRTQRCATTITLRRSQAAGVGRWTQGVYGLMNAGNSWMSRDKDIATLSVGVSVERIISRRASSPPMGCASSNTSRRSPIGNVTPSTWRGRE